MSVRIVPKCDSVGIFVQMIFRMLKSITHVGNDRAQPSSVCGGGGRAGMPTGSDLGSGNVLYTRFSLRLHY